MRDAINRNRNCKCPSLLFFAGTVLNHIYLKRSPAGWSPGDPVITPSAHFLATPPSLVSFSALSHSLLGPSPGSPPAEVLASDTAGPVGPWLRHPGDHQPAAAVGVQPMDAGWMQLSPCDLTPAPKPLKEGGCAQRGEAAHATRHFTVHKALSPPLVLCQSQ